jgi:hypothetical protein
MLECGKLKNLKLEAVKCGNAKARKCPNNRNLSLLLDLTPKLVVRVSPDTPRI